MDVHFLALFNKITSCGYSSSVLSKRAKEGNGLFLLPESISFYSEAALCLTGSPWCIVPTISLIFPQAAISEPLCCHFDVYKHKI